MSPFHSSVEKINSVFTPAKPIQTKELFSGRLTEIEKIQSTFLETGSHLILYGDRGVGKTSLANIVNLINSDQHSSVHCIKISCYPEDTFNDLWKKIFNDITVNTSTQKESIGFIKEATNKRNSPVLLLEALGLKQVNISVNEVLHTLKILQSKLDTNGIFIFDEFDVITDINLKKEFTYLLKALSDESLNHTVMLVGIAETIENLIESHQSLERCLKEIKLKNLSGDELQQIIDNGLKSLSLTMENSVKTSIIHFSGGLPHYTHLLSRESAKQAVLSSVNHITREHFDAAVEEAISNSLESTKRTYQKAVMNDSDHTIENVLTACALTKVDDYGCFTSTDIKTTLATTLKQKSLKQSYLRYLNRLCSPERGEILKKRGTSRQYNFEFKKPLLRGFIKMKAYDQGIL